MRLEEHTNRIIIKSGRGCQKAVHRGFNREKSLKNNLKVWKEMKNF